MNGLSHALRAFQRPETGGMPAPAPRIVAGQPNIAGATEGRRGPPIFVDAADARRPRDRAPRRSGACALTGASAMTHDTTSLAVKLRTLSRSIDALAARRHAEQLIPIVHRPGWTTVAESLLVHGILDHLQAQVDDLSNAYDALLAAAREVGTDDAPMSNATE